MPHRGRVLRRLSLPALVAGTAILINGCYRPVMLHVPMDYRPTDRLRLDNGATSLPPGQSLTVTVSDSRTDVSLIGKNVERAEAIPLYAERGTPDQFLREAVSRELTNAGLWITNDPDQATRVLHLDLTRFWTEESAAQSSQAPSLYRAVITANAELKAAGGKVLWQGGVGGDSKHSGRSLSPEEYQAAFSDAAVDLVHNLMKNDSFTKALVGREQPQAPAREPRRRPSHHPKRRTKDGGTAPPASERKN